MKIINGYMERLEQLSPVSSIGHVRSVKGLIVESMGPQVSLGDICTIDLPGQSGGAMAEVVGFNDNRVLLMQLEQTPGIRPNSRVYTQQSHGTLHMGDGVLGRILDGMGQPVDDAGPIFSTRPMPLQGDISRPLERPPICEPFHTGVSAIDAFTPLGVGQRVGLFAGSGVGKSTLMGMIARHSDACVNVLALIGERGREVREFIEHELGPEVLAKTVIVTATSDECAPMRKRAAFTASAIAEYFCQQGKNVLLLMDSVTRFAMAQREIGLSIGESPTARGYTPSCFNLLPRLFERAGNYNSGSITAIYTVLVEGDDVDEPLADAVRGLLDGHIVMERSLAERGQYPAINVLRSISRLSNRLADDSHRETLINARTLMSLYAQNEELIRIGAYSPGTSAELDRAIRCHPEIMDMLKQNLTDACPVDNALKKLKSIIQ